MLISVSAADDRWASTPCSSDWEVISETLGLDPAIDWTSKSSSGNVATYNSDHGYGTSAGTGYNKTVEINSQLEDK